MATKGRLGVPGEGRPSLDGMLEGLTGYSLLRALIDAIPDAVYLKDLDSRFIWGNPALARVLGLDDPAGAIGTSDIDYFHAMHALESLEDERAILRTGEPIVAKRELEERPDGSRRWVATTKVAVRDADGAIIGTAGISRDIDGVVRNEEALRESEERHRLISELMCDYVYTGAITAEGDIVPTWASGPIERVLGYSAEQLARPEGLRWLDLVEEEDRPRALASVARLREGQSTVTEYRARRADGAVVWLRDTVRPLWSSDGRRVEGFMGGVQDITAHKQVEADLRLSEERFRILADSVPALITVTDEAGRVTYANQAARELYEADEGDDLVELWLAALHPEDRERVLHGPHPELDPTGAVQREYRIIRRDGQTRWLLELSRPRRTEDGLRPGEVTCALDITDRHEALESRQRLEAQLQRAQRLESLGVLAGGIAHDINNALAVILGCAEQGALGIGGGPANPEVLFERIRQASLRAKAVVAQVLAFSRPAAPDRRTIRLQEELTDTVTLIRSGLPSTIALKTQLAPDCPAVCADPSLVQQVLLNLVANARDAIGEGHGSVSVKLRPITLDTEQAAMLRVSPGRYAYLRVADTGCGMDQATLARIFDPFFTTKPRSAGTGLGLASVHGMVTAHGGAVTADSTRGVGTIFRVYLPAVSSPCCEPGAEPADDDAVAPRGEGRILFLDDEPELTQLGVEMLSELGYRVTGETCATDALRTLMVPAHGYDLLVTDQTMPHLTGIELARRLRDAGDRTPVVLLTGYSPAIVDSDLRAAGILGLLAKPFAIGDLARLVRRAISSPAEVRGSGRS